MPYTIPQEVWLSDPSGLAHIGMKYRRRCKSFKKYREAELTTLTSTNTWGNIPYYPYTLFGSPLVTELTVTFFVLFDS